MEHILCSLM